MPAKKKAAKKATKPVAVPVKNKTGTASVVKKVVRTTPVRKPKHSHDWHYDGDFRNARGKRFQQYHCPTCGEEMTQESPDA